MARISYGNFVCLSVYPSVCLVWHDLVPIETQMRQRLLVFTVW